MNSERLLQHYEQIADAPDAIARLRRFILNLAVRGKLVPQDPNDEPASELLKRIGREKLDQTGLPSGWRRAKVGSILDFQYGKGLKASERLDEGPVPVFGSNGIVGFTDEPLTVRPAIIVGRKGSAGALNLCDGPSWTTDVAYFVEAPVFFDLRFMLNALAALDLDKLGKGVKPGLSRSEAYDQIIALPPLAEQYRIVAKVDELMGLCDRLEAAREAREKARDRLAAASLARLNVPDPETFQDDARFALDALPALTTRPDQIKGLRQTILNLAVRGKLVPQDPNEEPASELLKRRRDVGGNANLRRTVPEMVAVPIKLQSEHLPTGWCLESVASLLRIGAIIDLKDGNHGANHPKVSDFVDEGLPFITAAQVSEAGQIDYEGAYKLAGPPLDRLRVGFAQSGDVIYTHKGSVGRVALCNRDCVLSPQTTYYRLESSIIIDAFLRVMLLSDQFKDQVDAVKKQTTRDFVSIQKQYEFFIYLPPFAEQHRIVAKVDVLMALCDRLEASLTDSAATRRRLLDALLAEAPTPVGDVSSGNIETTKQVLHV